MRRRRWRETVRKRKRKRSVTSVKCEMKTEEEGGVAKINMTRRESVNDVK